MPQRASAAAAGASFAGPALALEPAEAAAGGAATITVLEALAAVATGMLAAGGAFDRAAGILTLAAEAPGSDACACETRESVTCGGAGVGRAGVPLTRRQRKGPRGRVGCAHL